MLLFLFLSSAFLAAPAAAQLMPNALPGGPAFHDQSYNVFLKQGGGDEGYKELLSSGHPLPVDPTQTLLRLYNTLVDLPTAVYNGAERLAQAVECAESRHVYLCTFLGTMCVVACGVLPALFMPKDVGPMLRDPTSPARRNLNRALAFSVGSLLGDVFLHLLPEIYAVSDPAATGAWVLGGLLFCLLLEKALASTASDSRRRLAALLNLGANVVDNGSHGLAIGGSFLLGPRVGWLTTAAILLHEIPHELSDFAILLRGDFSRWDAVKAQDSAGAAWILPFTAGGFLNIALVQLLPDILAETDRREGLVQLLLIFLGIGVMQLMNSALPAFFL